MIGCMYRLTLMEVEEAGLLSICCCMVQAEAASREVSVLREALDAATEEAEGGAQELAAAQAALAGELV